MKRLFDIVTAIIALIFFTPLMVIIAFLVKLNSKGPIVFFQHRIGLNDSEFVMWKFRTMVVGTPEVATDKLTNSNAYITSVGYYLRKYSLDELPQLINILLGHMSFVGPRPALYNQYQLRSMRNDLGIDKIRPGLTGWAQINGRDDISLEKKIELDYYYFNNRNFVFDLKVLFWTFCSIYYGTGVNQDSERKQTVL